MKIYVSSLVSAMLLAVGCASSQKSLSHTEKKTTHDHPYHVVSEHTHQHGPKCGHSAIQHGDHMDYVESGEWHAEHEDHWDLHGKSSGAPAVQSHSHRHGNNCGHKKVKHGSHSDYLHDGHYHHMESKRVSDHGELAAG